MLEELLGEGREVAYSPRRKPKDPNAPKSLATKLSGSLNSLFGGGKRVSSEGNLAVPAKSRSRMEVEREMMDKYYVPYTYELPRSQQEPMVMPRKRGGVSTQNCNYCLKLVKSESSTLISKSSLERNRSESKTKLVASSQAELPRVIKPFEISKSIEFGRTLSLDLDKFSLELDQSLNEIISGEKNAAFSSSHDHQLSNI